MSAEEPVPGPGPAPGPGDAPMPVVEDPKLIADVLGDLAAIDKPGAVVEDATGARYTRYENDWHTEPPDGPDDPDGVSLAQLVRYAGPVTLVSEAP